MSYADFAAVTLALTHRLQTAFSSTNGSISGAHVFAQEPQSRDTMIVPSVTVFMYHISPNVSHRNDDLPTRMQDGSLSRRPVAYFDVYYLLSFYGDDTAAIPESQLLWGLTAAVLHAQPVLASSEIASKAISLGPLGRLQPENDVRLLPHEIDSDTMARIWQSFAGRSYVPSMVYRATPVAVSIDLDPKTPLAVRQRKFDLKRSDDAVLGKPSTAAESSIEDGPARALVPGDDFNLDLVGLPQVDNLIAKVGDVRLPVKRTGANEGQVYLEPGRTPVGRDLPVSIFSPDNLVEPLSPDFHVSIFPKLELLKKRVKKGGQIKARFLPSPASDVQVQLLLNSLDGRVQIALAPEVVSSGADSAEAEFQLGSTASGRYFVRLSLSTSSGTIASLLDWKSEDGVGRFVGPILTIQQVRRAS